MNKLSARRRVGTGKGAGRRIRDNGMIPAVLYGQSGDAVNLALNPKELREILLSARGKNSIFSVEVDGGETVDCAMVREYQKDPVKRTLVHCDLLRLDPSKPRRFKVPFILIGTSKAEKLGGRVEFSTRDTWVECTPLNVPVNIEINTEELEPGDRIRIADVVAPDGVKLVYNQNSPIVSASSAAAAAEADAEDEAAGEATAAAEEGASE